MAIKIQGTTVIDDGRQLNVIGVNTISNVEISSGIVTAVSGVVTYYGDGSNLDGVKGGAISTNTANQAQYIPYAISFGSTSGFGATTLLVYNPSTTSLGIGTTSPDAAIHVVDDILVSAGAAATLDTRIKAYSNEGGSISFEDVVDGSSIFTLQQGDSDILFDVSTSPTNQVFQVGVDSSIIISSGVSTADFKIKAYDEELGAISFEDATDATQYFSITQDLSTILFSVNDANFDTKFVVDASGNVNVTGVITATHYYGDGSNLDGVEGSAISTNTANQAQYIPYAISFGSTSGFGATTLLVYNPSTTSLGIGTTSPDAAIHVVDDILVSAGAAATLDTRIKAYTNESGSISFEDSVDGSSIFTLQQGDSDILFDVSTSPTNQVFQVGVDSSIIISSGVSTADFKIKSYDEELGSISFEDATDATQYFSITQDLSTILFGVNDVNFDTKFVVDASGNVGIQTNAVGGGGTTALDVYGNVVISGSITKGSGTFTIPHPIDSSKLLVHSFIEGPKADLIYRGKSQLSNGISTIAMDSHVGLITGTWESLCRNPQVFVQNNESFSLVKASITEDGILTITSNDNINHEIDWMVIAERDDKVIKDAHWTDDNGNPILEPTK